LDGWTIVDRASAIKNPTLLINGRGDIVQDFVIAPFFQHIPKVKWVTLELATHTPFFEEPDRFFQLVSEFLAS
jgi:pimeloyl-ACP methyl ester carboxylesterase